MAPTSPVFCEVITRDPFVLVTRDDRGPFRPAALAGLRLGTVSEVPTPWLCLQHDMRLEGLDPDEVRRVADRSMTENAQALQQGALDAMQCFQPVAEALVEAGCHIWSAAADRGPCSYTTLYARRGVLLARREELTAMVRAIHATQTWLHGTDAADLAQVVTGYFRPSRSRV